MILELDTTAFRMVPAGGHGTRYLDAGSGPPVVLLHGLSGHIEFWARNVAPLAKRSRTIVLDLLGRGRTGIPDWTARPPQEQIYTHFVAFLDALGLEKVSLVGASLGGHTAAQLALRSPERVERLVIVGSGNTVNPPDLLARTLEDARANAESLRDPGPRSVAGQLAALVSDPRAIPAEVVSARQDILSDPARRLSIAQLAAELPRWAADPRIEVRSRLHRISAPTLFVWGREDRRSSWRQAEQAARTMPDARTIVLEGCGHACYIERPQEFNEIVLSFLSAERVGPPGSMREIPLTRGTAA